MEASETELWTALWTVSLSPEPMAFAMTTLVPSAMPMNRLSRRLVMGVLEPTAAMAAGPPSPESWPTIIVSMRALICSRMPVRATGSAKTGTLFQSEPWSMSRLGLLLGLESLLASASFRSSFAASSLTAAPVARVSTSLSADSLLPFVVPWESLEPRAAILLSSCAPPSGLAACARLLSVALSSCPCTTFSQLIRSFRISSLILRPAQSSTARAGLSRPNTKTKCARRNPLRGLQAFYVGGSLSGCRKPELCTRFG